ncbi:MAG: hypothetical protein EOP53_21665 [Sphingobacteriales bacterium]|nr:MAG: hypothetical protein EOP53_21665 [Sphingobacteriales bacterium]
MKRRNAIIGVAGLLAIGTTALALAQKFASTKNPPQTVEHVDLQKYLGKWYDIAHYPSRFQKNTTHSQANYSLREDGKIRVHNTCLKNGKPDDVKGKAWIVDKTTNAKLKVQFFWPFAGDYWILELADDYRYALVGEPKRKYVWLLSRTPKLAESDKKFLLKQLAFHGYSADKLHWEKQD